jgi:hypothetical protein
MDKKIEQKDSYRAITEEDAAAIAAHTVDRFVERLSDKATVSQITDAWAGQIDLALGRGLRRLAFWVFTGVVLLGSWKLDLLGKAVSAFKP